MRDAFLVWNLNAVEHEVVLRSSNDQYVAIPLPEERSEVFERLADSSGTVEATLVRIDEGGTPWRLERIHRAQEDRDK